MLIEKRVQLDLSRWIGKAVDDGLSTEQALAELRGRLIPWQAGVAGQPKLAAPKRAAPKRATSAKASRA